MVDLAVLAIDVVHLAALAKPTCLILALREDSDGYHAEFGRFDLDLEVLDVLQAYRLFAIGDDLLLAYLSYSMPSVICFFIMPFEVVAAIQL